MVHFATTPMLASAAWRQELEEAEETVDQSRDRLASLLEALSEAEQEQLRQMLGFAQPPPPPAQPAPSLGKAHSRHSHSLG